LKEEKLILQPSSSTNQNALALVVVVRSDLQLTTTS
jgi:hypothetical protein